jgi:hypothetical protein
MIDRGSEISEALVLLEQAARERWRGGFNPARLRRNCRRAGTKRSFMPWDRSRSE